MLENYNASPQFSPTPANRILNGLPPEDLERIAPNLEEVELELGQIIYQAEDLIDYLYFPNRGMISVIATTQEGQSAEGVNGIDALLGSNRSLYRHMVQQAGSATRIRTDAVAGEFRRGGALHESLLGFLRLMMIQVSQTALCNRLHSVEERLARWLLLCSDRAETKKLQLTQEFLAIMLGVNRPTVTVAAILLQSAGYIKYSRGRITIIDREGLEGFTCDCYQTVKKEYDCLLL